MRAFVVVSAVVLAACFSKPDRVELDPVDAPSVTLVDATRDPTSCDPATCDGTCAGDGFCEIQGDSSGGDVTCPRGKKCRVLCSSSQCKDGVVCRDAAACEVRCIGKDACQGSNFPAVDCGGASCTVVCDGEAACEKGVRGMAGRCTASCCGVNACKDGISACTRGTTCD